MDSFVEFIFEKVLMPIVAVAAVLFVVGIIAAPILYFLENKDNPTVVLDKTEFTCTQTYRYTTQTMVKSGNVFVPFTNHHTRCDQWTRN